MSIITTTNVVLLIINLGDMGCIMPSYAHTGKSRCTKTKLIRGSEVEKGVLVVMWDYGNGTLDYRSIAFTS